MAARLEFEAVLGTSGFGAGMTKLEATVAAANSRMAKYQAGIASEMARGGGIDSAINEAILIQNFKDAENAAASATKAIGFNRGAMQELLVIFREIGRGNWSRVPGSVTLFAQRLGLLEKAISTNAATGGIMLTTVGLLAGAIVAAGVAAYVTYRYFHGLAQAATDLNEALKGGKETLEKHDAAMMKSAEAAQAYRDWLKKLEEGHDSFSEAVMGAVKQMREEFEIRQKIASLNGQTNSQAQTARELQDQKELAVIERAKAQAEMDFKKAKDESAKSEKEAQDLAKRAQTAAEAAKETAKLADEEAKKSGLAAGALLFGLGLINPMLPGAKQAIDAAGSFDPAKAHSASAYDATQISALAKAAADKAADDKRKAESAKTDLDKLGKDVADRRFAAGLNPLEEQAAALQDARRGLGRNGNGDSLVRSGNFLGSSRGQIETLAEEANRIAREHLAVSREIARNTRHPSPGTNHFSGIGGG